MYFYSFMLQETLPEFGEKINLKNRKDMEKYLDLAKIYNFHSTYG
jgi:hypothetical protein